MAQTVKRLPAMRETQVRTLDQEDLLEKEMAIHSSTLTWKIPWMEEFDRLHSPWGRKESDTTERLHFHFHSELYLISCNKLQWKSRINHCCFVAKLCPTLLGPHAL